MDLPAPFEQPFLDDILYHPEVLFLDRIEEIDREASRVVCRMPTDRPMPFMDSQRSTYPKHVAGAVMVQVTAMLGFVHLYYLEGKRSADGWIGFGTHIDRAVFRKMVPPGTPMLCSCTQVRVRRGAKRIFSKYKFEFRHEGAIAFQSEQSAMWILQEPGAPPLGAAEPTA